MLPAALAWVTLMKKRKVVNAALVANASSVLNSETEFSYV